MAKAVARNWLGQGGQVVCMATLLGSPLWAQKISEEARMYRVSEPFWLHEATRRRICIGVFVLGCLMPTVGLLVWAGWRNSPWYLHQQAAEAERLLGLVVRLEGIDHPRPAEAIYHQVELADPDTGVPLLQAEQVQIRWSRSTAPAQGCLGRIELAFQGLEISTEGLGRLVELVDRVLSQPANWPAYEVELKAPEVRLRRGQQLRTLSELTGFVQPLEAGTRGAVSFRLEGSQPGQPIHIRFGRDRRCLPPISGVELALGESIIPCCLLEAVLPGLERLGPLASLQGTLWLYQAEGKVEYRFQGELFQVDLRTLLGQELGLMLSGLAQIQVEEARIVQGRLEEAVAVLRGGPGTLSRRFWQGAVQEWGLSTTAQPASDQESFSYEQLGLALRIGPEGLRLRGLCSGAPPGSILVSAEGVLLGESPTTGQAIPIASLVRVLTGAPLGYQSFTVPATRQVEQLLRLLPLPTEVLPGSRAMGLADSASRTELP